MTGARRGELCALKWNDVDVCKGEFTISRFIVKGRTDQIVEKDTKTHSSRTIALYKDTCKVLKEWNSACNERASKCSTKLVSKGLYFL